MVAAKRYWVKLKAPGEFLKTLPDFPTPISKTKLKRLAAEERKAGTTASPNGSKASSPSPQKPKSSSVSVKAGPSSSGLANGGILDKSGKPCRRWTKRSRQFKTFSGFKVKILTYKSSEVKPEPMAV